MRGVDYQKVVVDKEEQTFRVIGPFRDHSEEALGRAALCPQSHPCGVGRDGMQQRRVDDLGNLRQLLGSSTRSYQVVHGGDELVD